MNAACYPAMHGRLQGKNSPPIAIFLILAPLAAFGQLLAAPVPFENEGAPPAPDPWQINGKNQKAQGNHPEAEYGQKAQYAAENEQNANDYAGDLRFGQAPLFLAYANFRAHDNSPPEH
jgi:hypothetical protein